MSQQKTIVILGSTSVGKSALTLRYIRDEFPDYYAPTIMNPYIKSVVTANNTKYDLTVYDTAGLESQSEIQTLYMNSNGFILVYSITDRQSFETVIEIFEKLKEALNGENKPVILIGNKIDLQEKRRITVEEGKKLARDMKAEFLETSAKLNNNVTDAFITIVNAIDRISNDQKQQQYNNNNINNNSNNVPNKNNNNNNNNQFNQNKQQLQRQNTNNSKNNSCIIT